MPFPQSVAARLTLGAAVVALVALLVAATSSSSPVPVLTGIGHELDVHIDVDTGALEVVDQVSFDQLIKESPPFALHFALTPEVAGGHLERVGGGGHASRYRVTLDTPARSMRLTYQGRIGTAGRRTLGGMPVATVEPEGVYLDGASAWYPRFEGTIERFTLRVGVPGEWRVVSQGRAQADHRTWVSETPQDDIYLIAAPFRHYGASHEGTELGVYLLREDPELATRYLQVMGAYLDLYGGLIGAYPYPKFAVVENRWQTGFGMPSFTLLGSRVLRLPFIPYTSLPHEILHNWWGNGVWVDYEGGNWSEGLTAYLSDHLMKEFQDGGARHRLAALERYANFATEGRDFPLVRFVSRHDDASQAVGYSKSLMLFHMLRRELGDEAFRNGLRRLWQERRHEPTGFVDVLELLTAPGTGVDYQPWLSRTGAPRLGLAEVALRETGGGYALDFTLLQEQQAAPFAFRLPVAITFDGEPTAHVRTLTITDRATPVSWHFERRPVRMDVDPAFDVMRLLDPREKPPSLALLLGAPTQHLVVPADATPAAARAWRELATAWERRFANIEVRTDSDPLPADADAVWLLGWDNRHLRTLGQALAGPRQSLEADGVVIAGSRHAAGERAVVLIGPRPHERRLGFIGARSPATIRALAGKLPHYASFGRLVFDERDAANLSKERLMVAASPLTRHFAEPHHPLELPARPKLAPAPF